MLKRVYIETYGCQMNVADSELMFGVLGREGYVRAETPDDADVMLVNTCAVRDNAEQRVIGRVGELQRHKRAGRRAGCGGLHGSAAWARPSWPRCREWTWWSVPMPTATCLQLIGLAHGGQRVSDTEFRSWEHYEDVPAVREKGPTAFVTVQRGCDYRCTFCIVPTDAGTGAEPAAGGRAYAKWPAWWSRAPPRSRCWGRRSTAITTASTTSPTCCGPWAASTGSGESASPARTRPISRPGSSRPWRPPRPSASTSTCRCRAARMRCSSACSGATPASDIWRSSPSCAAPFPASPSRPTSSSGFPGETDDQFEATLSLVTEADFDDAYTFKYSVREGTPAVRLKDHVADEVASARLARLIEAVRANVRRKNMARIGETHEVLVERPARRGDLMLARTRTNQLVLLDLPATAIGEYHTRSAHRYHRIDVHWGGAGPSPAQARSQLAVL